MDSERLVIDPSAMGRNGGERLKETANEKLHVDEMGHGSLRHLPTIRATSFSRTRGKLTIDVHSPTSKIYATYTPPKDYKGSTIPHNGGNQNLRHTVY
ncbi:unnamed protein product [Prunus armeniaca]